MADYFSIAFEQVELVDGLEPDQRVWLFMQASVFNEDDLITALHIEQVGSLPPDANRQAGDLPTGNAGLFALGLPIGQALRNDRVAADTGQVFPRFELSAVPVNPGQVLELQVIMLPQVWLKTITIPPDQVDKWTQTVFVSLLASSGFGLVGTAAGAIVGFLWGNEDQDVEVPCMQSVVTARHSYSHDDLITFRSESMRRYGPRDNDNSAVCGEIDSYYWLSVDQHAPLSFGPMRPIEAHDCELRPWKKYPPASWVHGVWMDSEAWQKSCIAVAVNVTSDKTANVIVYDEPAQPSSAYRTFDRRQITVDIAHPPFVMNVFDDDCPSRTVKPICPTCKRFTNIPKALPASSLMLAAIAMGTRHDGAGRWLDGQVGQSSGSTNRCGPSPSRRGQAVDHGAATRLGPATLFRPGTGEIWPVGSPPPPRDPPRPPPGLDRWASEAPGDMYSEVVQSVLGCFRISLSENEDLYSYAEVPPGRSPDCPRLRYVKRSSAGTLVADIMLALFVAPPR